MSVLAHGTRLVRRLLTERSLLDLSKFDVQVFNQRADKDASLSKSTPSDRAFTHNVLPITVKDHMRKQKKASPPLYTKRYQSYSLFCCRDPVDEIFVENYQYQNWSRIAPNN